MFLLCPIYGLIEPFIIIQVSNDSFNNNLLLNKSAINIECAEEYKDDFTCFHLIYGAVTGVLGNGN